MVSFPGDLPEDFEREVRLPFADGFRADPSTDPAAE
jgi:hypothetical protein